MRLAALAALLAAVAILTVSICGYVLDRAFLAARGRLLAWSAEEAPTG